MFKKIAIWYLKKCKVSVVMNVEISDCGLRLLSCDGYLYDNVCNTKIKARDYTLFELPKGKVCIKHKVKKEEK